MVARGVISSPAKNYEFERHVANDNETIFAETYELVDDTYFNWMLTSEFPDGNEAMMSGIYPRVRAPN